MLGKEAHIFILSGTSLILEGPAGYTYAMQHALDLTACKSFGVGKHNLFRRMIFVQPSTNNTTRPDNKSNMKGMMAHLSVESTNTARLLSISSSSANFTLRTFLSATEKVKVEERKDDVRRDCSTSSDMLTTSKL